MNYYPTERAWFCLRSQPKHEHIASANLRRLADLEVFCPRIRSRKITRRGPVWMTESLFPNYLFVKFDFRTQLEAVKYTSGISHIIHFADRYPTVPDVVIEDLGLAFGGEDLHVTADVPNPGDRVIVADQAFFGMEATVLRVMPAKDRVQVLIDMLGRTTTVELRLGYVVPAAQPVPALLLS